METIRRNNRESTELMNITTEEVQRQQPFFYWLSSVEGIGNLTIRRLLGVMGKPERIYYATKTELLELKEKKILGEKQFYNLQEARKNANIYSAYDKLQEEKISMIPFYHPEYPERLRNIPDPPAVLFVKGQLPVPEKKSLAVIGARNCSAYGKRMAQEFAGFLGNKGIQIISGMARGVDGISQMAALTAGGKSFGVLGCGVDICYPDQNREVYEELIRNGGVISAYRPGTKPQSRYFPPRNRIISGLADALLVIEAREKSGTLITVDMALEQGKEVYALPGRVGDPVSEGCNRLIAQGAGVALSPDALFAEISGVTKCARQEYAWDSGCITELPVPSHFNEIECQIYQILDDYPKTLEEIYDELEKSYKSTIKICNLMQIMVELCIQKYAEPVNGGLAYIKRKP